MDLREWLSQSPVACPEGAGERELYHGCVGMPLKRLGVPVHLSQSAACKGLGGSRRRHCSELCVLGFINFLHTLSSLHPVRIYRPSCKPIRVIGASDLFCLNGPKSIT